MELIEIANLKNGWKLWWGPAENDYQCLIDPGTKENPNLAEFAFSKSFEPTAATRCRKCVEKLASLVEADTRILILASLRDLT